MLGSVGSQGPFVALWFDRTKREARLIGPPATLGSTTASANRSGDALSATNTPNADVVDGGGDRTAGDRTAGDRMVGDRMVGDRMAGHRMAGDWMAGDHLRRKHSSQLRHDPSYGIEM